MHRGKSAKIPTTLRSRKIFTSDGADQERVSLNSTSKEDSAPVAIKTKLGEEGTEVKTIYCISFLPFTFLYLVET